MIPVYLVNLFWLLYNLLGVILAIFVCFEKQRVRKEERFEIQHGIRVELGGTVFPADLIDISFKGCAVEPRITLENPDTLVGEKARIEFEGCGLGLDAQVFRSRGWGRRIIFLFGNLSTEQHTGLVKFIFNRQDMGFGQFTSSTTRTLPTFKKIGAKWWKEFMIRG